MDPLSALGAAGSVVGIASFGVQLSKVLVQFTLQVATAQENLRMILEGIHATNVALGLVHEFLAEECKNLEDKRQAKLFSPKAINEVKVIADKCLIIFWRVESAVKNKSSNPQLEDDLVERLKLFNERLCGGELDTILPDPDSIRLSAWRKLCWPYIAPKLDNYTSQLHGLQNSLTLIFTIISVGAQRHNSKRKDEDSTDLPDLYVIAGNLAIQTNICNNTIVSGESTGKGHPRNRQTRGTARGKSANHSEKGAKILPEMASRGSDITRPADRTSKAQMSSPVSQIKETIVSQSSGPSRSTKNSVRFEGSLAGPLPGLPANGQAVESRSHENARLDFVKGSEGRITPDSKTAQQHRSSSHRALRNVDEDELESSISVHSTTPSIRSKSRSDSVSTDRSARSTERLTKAIVDEFVNNKDIASVQQPQDNVHAENDQEGWTDTRKNSDKVTSPRTAQRVSLIDGGFPEKVGSKYADSEILGTAADVAERQRPPIRQKEKYEVDEFEGDWPHIENITEQGQVRSKPITVAHDDKPQSSSPVKRREPSRKAKSAAVSDPALVFDTLSKASIERNRDPDESMDAGSEKIGAGYNHTRQEEHPFSSSTGVTKQPHRFSSFMKGVFAGEDSDPDSSIRCYVIKMGEAHEVPHSGSLKLTKSFKRNADTQPLHQSWYKIFAFMASEDRAAIQRIIYSRNTDHSCTIVHLKKLREKTVKFWDKSCPAYFAVVKDDLSRSSSMITGLPPSAPLPPVKSIPIWGVDVPLTQSQLRERVRVDRVHSGATSPIITDRNRLRQDSIQIQDITAASTLGESGCLDRLTTFAFFSMRKAIATSLDVTPTWERIEIVDERLSQSDIIQQISKLSKSNLTLGEKKMALHRFQRDQITWLLDDLASKESDSRFKWELAQLDYFEEGGKKSKKKSSGSDLESTTILVFVRRIPRPDLNLVRLYSELHRPRDKTWLSQPPSPPLPPTRYAQGRESNPFERNGNKSRVSRKSSLNSSLMDGSSVNSGTDSESAPIEFERITHRSSLPTRAHPQDTRSKSKHDPGHRYRQNVERSSSAYTRDYRPELRKSASAARKEEVYDEYENPFDSIKPARRDHNPAPGPGRPPPVPKTNRHPIPAPPSSVDPVEDSFGYGRGYYAPESFQQYNSYSQTPGYGQIPNYGQIPSYDQTPNYPQPPYYSQPVYHQHPFHPSSYYLPGGYGHVNPFGQTWPSWPPSDPSVVGANPAEEQRVGLYPQGSKEPQSTKIDAGRQYSSYPQFYDKMPFNPRNTQVNRGEKEDKNAKEIVDKLLLEWTPGTDDSDSSSSDNEGSDPTYNEPDGANNNETYFERDRERSARRTLSEQRTVSGDQSRRATVDDAEEEHDKTMQEPFTIESMSSSSSGSSDDDGDDEEEEEEEEAEEKENRQSRKKFNAEQRDAWLNSRMISDARTDSSPNPMDHPQTEASNQPAWLDPSWAQDVVNSTSTREYAPAPAYSQPTSTPRPLAPKSHRGGPTKQFTSSQDPRTMSGNRDFVRRVGMNTLHEPKATSERRIYPQSESMTDFQESRPTFERRNYPRSEGMHAFQEPKSNLERRGYSQDEGFNSVRIPKPPSERRESAQDKRQKIPIDRTDHESDLKRQPGLARRFGTSDSMPPMKVAERLSEKRATSDTTRDAPRPFRRGPLQTRSPADMGW